MSNFTEELFDAIQLITDKTLSKIEMDKTIICRITDASKKSEGKYRVRNNDLAFWAFCENDTYTEGDEVRVVIPSDTTAQKYIIGKYVSDDGSPVAYVSPADSVINISGDLIGQAGTLLTFKAGSNGDLKKYHRIWAVGESYANITSNGVYDTIVIKGDFRTLLKEDKAGEYGIEMHVYIEDNETMQDHAFTFSCKEMFGDPYDFQVYTPQSKAFVLPNTLGTTARVTAIGVMFYQTGFQKITEIDNILIRNFEMWLGSDVATVPNNTAKIYTNNTMTYKYLPGDSSTNSKTLNLLWYKKDETSGKYIKCDFTDRHDAIGELLADQIQTKVSAQAGKEDGPTTVRALYAAAANKENISNLSALTKLLQTDIKSLVRTFGSQSGLMNDGTVQKLMGIGASANVWETGLKNWFETLTDTAWNVDVDAIPDYHGYCNSVIAEMDEFFYEREEEDDYPEQVANAVGTYDIYVAKWQVLKSKIEAYLSKIYPMAGDQKLFDKTLEELEDLTKDYDTWLEAQEAEAAEDEKEEYTCYWFKYDPSVTLTSDQAKFTSVAGTGWVVIDGNQGKTNIEVDCARNQETQRFKCIVAVNSLFYESNELVFTNEDELTSYETLDQADSLIIQHGSKSQGAYLLYGDDNYLLEKSNASVRRTLSLAYDGVLAGDEVMHNGHAFWYVPNSNTMLTVETAYLEAQGFIKQTSGDWASRHSGYDCWYRKLVDANHTDEGAAARDLDLSESTSECDYQGSNEFYYKIKEFYEPTASVNSIICEFVIADTEDPVYTETWFSFGQKGTSGTMYTLSITPQTNVSSTSPAREVETKVEDEEGKETTKWVDGGRLLLDVALYDGDMQPMELNNFSCEWVNKVGNNLSSENGVITVPSETFGILKAKAVVDIINTDNDGIRTVDLTTLFAVPYSATYKEIVNEKELTQTYVFSGPTRIIYTSLGVLDYTSLYRNPLKLYKRDGSEVTDVTWSITHLPEGDGIDKKVLPTLDGEKETYLKPCETYFTTDDDVWCYVTAKDSSGNILWQQPIIVTQSAYGYAVLNDWDGTLEIDETTGTIKGTMFMAGKKTNNNTFDGVVMGDVKTGLQNSKAGEVGIYGFNESIESFGLTIDGKAFFGKPGSGQIFFDGNKGTIRSSEWTENVGWGDGSKWRSDCKGMEIDFDDATIRMVGDTTEYATIEDGEYAYEVTDDNERKRVVSKNGDGVAPNIIITARPQDTKKTYFEIQGVKDGELSSLMKVGQEDYYLQSLGFDDEKHLGTKIDIGKGTITSYDFKINAFGGDPSEQTVLLNSNPEKLDDCYFKIGKDSGSFISFTKNGALDIYANKLTLASPLSSANLLRNTGPCERPKYKTDEDGNEIFDASGNKILLPLTYGWDGGEAYYATEGTRTCVEFNGDPSQSDVNIAKDKWYTISGELLFGSFNFYTASVAQEFSTIGRFEYTFQANENATYIYFNGDACVYHLKLEQNTSATPWCEHIDDAKQYAKDKDDEYDEQLLQDQVFAKLTNNGDSRGIFLEGGQLYINADYLSTGIIRSSNWKGSYSGPDGKTYETAEEYLQAKEEGLRSKEEAVRKKWDGFTPKITATDGMYINLNDGKIWSKTFELNAWDDSKGGLYLSSTENASFGYLKVGINSAFLQYSSDGLKIVGGSISGGSLNINDKCQIFEDGSIAAIAGTIGNFTIGDGDLVGGRGFFSSKGKAVTIGGTEYNIVLGVSPETLSYTVTLDNLSAWSTGQTYSCLSNYPSKIITQINIFSFSYQKGTRIYKVADRYSITLLEGEENKVVIGGHGDSDGAYAIWLSNGTVYAKKTSSWSLYGAVAFQQSAFTCYYCLADSFGGICSNGEILGTTFSGFTFSKTGTLTFPATNTSELKMNGFYLTKSKIYFPSAGTITGPSGYGSIILSTSSSSSTDVTIRVEIIATNNDNISVRLVAIKTGVSPSTSVNLFEDKTYSIGIQGYKSIAGVLQTKSFTIYAGNSSSTSQSFEVNNTKHCWYVDAGGEFHEIEYKQSATYFTVDSYTQASLNSNQVNIKGDLLPTSTTTYNLGHPNYLWNNIYASTAEINTSDRILKHQVDSIQDSYSSLFDSLQPVTYKLNNGTSNRTHTGFIAQDVKSAIEAVGLTTQDFAGYCEWENDDPNSASCGLRYEEFIPLCVNEIQKLKKRVAELEGDIEQN